jgi:AcrR family transcriptional regulator
VAAKSRPAGSARREEILLVAAGLFAQKGVAATTVREIADACDMIAGSLYHHFESKDEMVDELLSRSLTQLQTWYRACEAEHAEPEDRLRALIRASFRSLETHPAACAIYLRDYAYLRSSPRFLYLDTAYVASRRMWLSVIAAGIEKGVFRADIDADMMERFITTPLWMTVLWYKTSHLTLEEIGEQFVRFVLEGVRVSPS